MIKQYILPLLLLCLLSVSFAQEATATPKLTEEDLANK